MEEVVVLFEETPLIYIVNIVMVLETIKLYYLFVISKELCSVLTINLQVVLLFKRETVISVVEDELH